MSLANAIDAAPTATRDRLDRDAGCLVGSRCATCGSCSWPGRAVCQRCGSADAERAPLASAGRLVTHTTVWISRPGLEAPFTLGQVELPEGILVFGHIRGIEESDRVPLPVALQLAPDAAAIPPFWFEPVRA